MDLFDRFGNNPIIKPADVPPSRAGLTVPCVLNPGAFVYGGRIGLMLRVCEQPIPEAGYIGTCIRDPEAPGGVRIIRYRKDDPNLVQTDPRIFAYDGVTYLMSLSHLRLAWSTDGRHFEVEPRPALEGEGIYETYGVEDCRVNELEGEFHLTFTSVSPLGVAIGHATTTDFKNFIRHGLLFLPHNKDCVLFPRKIDGRYVAIHRPSGADVGGHFMWLSRSTDLEHWGRHHGLAMTRPGKWDGRRIGANGPPILTDRGWLQLYHGADKNTRYCWGAMLLAHDDPTKVLARSDEPIMQPRTDYELRGFFGNVVFSNGHVVKGDELTVYYGAADEYVGGATGSIRAILDSLK
jgi:predicted GH43/DUF377 family glycosyl hydrolase